MRQPYITAGGNIAIK